MGYESGLSQNCNLNMFQETSQELNWSMPLAISSVCVAF